MGGVGRPFFNVPSLTCGQDSPRQQAKEEEEERSQPPPPLAREGGEGRGGGGGGKGQGGEWRERDSSLFPVD